MKRSGSPKPVQSLFGLAFVELFVNQAIPTGGLSGSIVVVRGLARRGAPAATAITALLIASISYYAANLLVALLAFILLWNMGDFSDAWKSLAIAFVVVVLLIGAALFSISRSHGKFIPKAAYSWKPVARIAKIFGDVDTKILSNTPLLIETVGLQILIILLDSATLWTAGRAVGLALEPVSAFISFVLASVVATLTPVPMGLGTFEGTSTGMLHFFGSSIEGSLAATLILRGFTLWLPMLPGLWLLHRETRIGHRKKDAA